MTLMNPIREASRAKHLVLFRFQSLANFQSRIALFCLFTFALESLKNCSLTARFLSNARLDANETRTRVNERFTSL